MVDYTLETLAGAYGDALLTIADFAHLAGLDPARLRSQRLGPKSPKARVAKMVEDESGLAGFPLPVGEGRYPQYRLDELAAFSLDKDLLGPEPLDPETLHIWAFNRSVRRCMAIHGPERTLKFLCGVALVATAAQKPAELGEPTGDGIGTLPGRIRIAVESGLVHTPDPGPPLTGFEADKAPVNDSIYMESELLGSSDARGSTRAGSIGPPKIEDDSRSAGVMAFEVLTLQARLDERPDRFAELVDGMLASLRSSGRRSASFGSERVIDLLNAVADPQPGMSVFDPACGEGSSLLKAIELCGGPGAIAVTGRDLEPRAWLVTRTRFAIRNLPINLGRPRADSLNDHEPLGPFDCVVTEPDDFVSMSKRWIVGARSFLAPDGRAAVQLPDAVLTYGETAEWIGEGDVLGVVTLGQSERVAGTDGDSIWALQRGWTGPMLMIDLRPDTRRTLRREARGSMTPDQETAVVRELFRQHRAEPFTGDDDPRLQDLPTGLRAAVVDPAQIATTLAESRDPESDVLVARAFMAKSASPPRQRVDPDGGEFDLRPSSWVDTAARREEVRREAREMAARAVRDLRWLLDDDPELAASEGDIRNDEVRRLRSVLADDSTEEIRRALKRLQDKVEGFETRGPGGRKPSSTRRGSRDPDDTATSDTE
jgi:hypothetical protein